MIKSGIVRNVVPVIIEKMMSMERIANAS